MIKDLFKHYKVGKIMVVWGVMVEVGGRGDCLINKDGKPPKKLHISNSLQESALKLRIWSPDYL